MPLQPAQLQWNPLELAVAHVQPRRRATGHIGGLARMALTPTQPDPPCGRETPADGSDPERKNSQGLSLVVIVLVLTILDKFDTTRYYYIGSCCNVAYSYHCVV